MAALTLSLFISLYLMLAFVLFMNGQSAWVPAFVALAACYGVAFMGVAAEWFWGRWFAAGLGWSGAMIAVASLVMSGQWSPVLGIFGGLHGLVVLMLAGQKMVERFDGQPAWRERYGMDEFGVARLRKTVTRASASLPSVILWALGPKNPEEGMLLVAASVAAGLLAVGGLGAVVRMRSWGLVALGAAGALLVPFASFGPSSLRYFAVSCPAGGFSCMSETSGWVGWVGSLLSGGLALPAILLAGAVVPFALPALRYVRAHR